LASKRDHIMRGELRSGGGQFLIDTHQVLTLRWPARRRAPFTLRKVCLSVTL